MTTQALAECQRLKTLRLFCLQLTTNLFGFSTLTAMNLSCCSISFSDDCCDFSEGFPNLNQLCLHSCDFGRFKVLKLSGSQLHTLSITGLRYKNVYEGCKVEIFAPKLTFLCYRLSTVTDFDIINLPSLQHADIDALPYGSKKPDKDKDKFFKVFRGLYNAQLFTLWHSTIQALDEVTGLEHQPSPFSRLKSLKLRHLCHLRFPLPLKVATYLLKGCSCAGTPLVEFHKQGSLRSCCGSNF